MNQQELLKSVNPSYTTGKGCLAMLLGTGDPDAAELVKTIDLSELQKKQFHTGQSDEKGYCQKLYGRSGCALQRLEPDCAGL